MVSTDKSTRVIWNLPNFLSFLRIPLALLLLLSNPLWRCLAVTLAMISDGLDGHLARRYGQCTVWGKWLDPLADKIFVVVGLLVLLQEQRLTFFEAVLMLSRDYAILLFVVYLFLTGNAWKYRSKPFWCGKISTCLQLSVLFTLLWGMPVPFAVYGAFAVLGLLAYLELQMQLKALPLPK